MESLLIIAILIICLIPLKYGIDKYLEKKEFPPYLPDDDEWDKW